VMSRLYTGSWSDDDVCLYQPHRSTQGRRRSRRWRPQRATARSGTPWRPPPCSTSSRATTRSAPPPRHPLWPRRLADRLRRPRQQQQSPRRRQAGSSYTDTVVPYCDTDTATVFKYKDTAICLVYINFNK
jgi:hypothetical protein